MKNWLTIGQIAKQVGVSPKALRMYEEMGLLKSHTRGANGYRYYQTEQLELLQRLKEFKDLGFSLAEIKGLLEIDFAMNSQKLKSAMHSRLELIRQQRQVLRSQTYQIESILSSLEKNNEPLGAHQRRAIMSYYGKNAIVVTGCGDLSATANYIQLHFKKSGQEVPILKWSSAKEIPEQKPYILILNENELCEEKITGIHADTIVITQLNDYSAAKERLYLRLYTEVGAHVTTIFNADDRASVALAANESIRQGRTFYFSKNGNLTAQIESIGGVVSDGNEVRLYAFNLKREEVRFRFSRIIGFAEEVALLSSLAAVLTVGLDKTHLQIP